MRNILHLKEWAVQKALDHCAGPTSSACWELSDALLVYHTSKPDPVSLLKTNADLYTADSAVGAASHLLYLHFAGEFPQYSTIRNIRVLLEIALSRLQIELSRH